jgi:hypothetical protein
MNLQQHTLISHFGMLTFNHKSDQLKTYRTWWTSGFKVYIFFEKVIFSFLCFAILVSCFEVFLCLALLVLCLWLHVIKCQSHNWIYPYCNWYRVECQIWLVLDCIGVLDCGLVGLSSASSHITSLLIRHNSIRHRNIVL